MRFPIVTLLALAWMAGCSQQPESAPPAEKPLASPVKILQFYASSGEVAKGEAVTVCYGVENAQSVRMEPEVEQLRPALNRCFQVTPTTQTTYTLAAEGFDGSTATESFTVRVKPRASSAAPEHLIRFLTVSSTEIALGQTATLCYSAPDATSVSMEPNVKPLEPAARFCLFVKPQQTTTYTLSATGPGGKTDKMSLTVTVR